jgi:phage tail sheath protein FI
MTRPGVYVSEAPLPRVVANPNTSEAVGGFLGTALRGPTDPTLVTSWSDFVSKFGGFGSATTLPDALYQFFNNGGGAAYVARVLASDAVAAAATFNDGTSSRLTITAKSEGVWGNGVSVDIATNANDTTFTLSVREMIRGSNVVVERFRSLSMDQTSPRYVEGIVNSPTIGSAYITVTDIEKDDTALDDGGTATLTSGSDGVAAITSGDYDAAFDGFDAIDANFVFNAPGVADVSSLVAKIEGPTGRQDSIIVVDTAENQTPDMSGASLPNSAYAAVYFPWIYISDPAPDAIRGGIKKVPPGASVVGMILRTDNSRGVFKAPAGVSATLSGAVASEQRLTNTELDDLAGQNINVVRPVPGSGIAVMGARTRAFGTTDQYISVRRTINYVKKRAVEVIRFALFEPNSPTLWEQLRVANGAFLSELWQIGGLAGLDFSQAFYVKCDADNNTAQTISNGEVNVEIGIAPAFPAEFVVIRVGQFEADASTVVTEEV